MEQDRKLKALQQELKQYKEQWEEHIAAVAKKNNNIIYKESLERQMKPEMSDEEKLRIKEHNRKLQQQIDSITNIPVLDVGEDIMSIILNLEKEVEKLQAEKAHEKSKPVEREEK